MNLYKTALFCNIRLIQFHDAGVGVAVLCFAVQDNVIVLFPGVPVKAELGFHADRSIGKNSLIRLGPEGDIGRKSIKADFGCAEAHTAGRN